MNKDSNLFEKTITNDDSIDDDDFISADDVTIIIN
jgi:hypothetical protein